MERQIGTFIWDLEKEVTNIKKHGVDFTTACNVFKIPIEKFTLILSTARKKRDFFVSGRSKIRF